MAIKTDYSDVKFKNNGKLKLLIIVGTRPEIIRLAEVLKKCDEYFEHVLVHTGQNWDYTLNDVFFEELELRKPNHFLGVVGNNLGETMGNIIAESYRKFNAFCTSLPILHIRYNRLLYIFV